MAATLSPSFRIHHRTGAATYGEEQVPWYSPAILPRAGPDTTETTMAEDTSNASNQPGPCPRCGHRDGRLGPGKGPHAASWICTRWLRWVSKADLSELTQGVLTDALQRWADRARDPW